MRKVYERINQVISLCFEKTHKDTFFSTSLYISERDTYYFKGFIKKLEVKMVAKDGE